MNRIQAVQPIDSALLTDPVAMRDAMPILVANLLRDLIVQAQTVSAELDWSTYRSEVRQDEVGGQPVWMIRSKIEVVGQ